MSKASDIASYPIIKCVRDFRLKIAGRRGSVKEVGIASNY